MTVTFWLWCFVGYIALDRLVTIGLIGKEIEITKAYAVCNMLTGAAAIWLLVSAVRAIS